MKKKWAVIVCVLVLALMLIPIRGALKDGGSTQYHAVLYTVTDVHRIVEDGVYGYEEGLTVEILGFEVYNSVRPVPLGF